MLKRYPKIFMKLLPILIAAGLLNGLPVVCLAESEDPLKAWVYPESTVKEHSNAPTTVTSADGSTVQTFRNASGQYLTEDPFHAVVKFYVEKSGFAPSNWSILGRKFPGTEVHIPAHFSKVDIYREKPSVTILHYIRKDSASLQLLMTDLPDAGFMSVSVTRGKEDTETLVQIVHHPANPIKKG